MQEFDPLKLENQLCFPLYAASREIVNRYRPLLAPLGLTYTQYIALMVLWEHKEISAKEMGERLRLDSGTLTPLLKELEKKGLIVRRRSECDERVLIAEITEKGKTLRDMALEVPAKIAGCVPLLPQEAAELYRILYKILGNS